MIKISELKEGDVLKTKYNTLTVLQNLGKVVVVEYEDMTTQIFSEKELNNHNYQLVPPTPEKKYFMGFEVREYPERPIVEVKSNESSKWVYLRRLIEIKEDCVICVSEGNNVPTPWNYIYRIPETKIVEPTSSGTREGDGC